MKSVAVLVLLLFVSSISPAQNTFTTTEHVRFSPDGKQVVFSSAVYQASTTAGSPATRISARIAVMNIDGTNLKFITTVSSKAADASPVISSDGKKIVFRRDNLSAAGEPGDIYIINIDGSGIKQLSNKSEHETNPEFTVDGKGVIYVRQYFVGMGKASNGELIYADITGTNEKVLLQKEMRVVQAIPLTIGRGGYLVACGETNDKGDIMPTGSMLIMASPDGETAPKSKMLFPGKEKIQIKHIRVVQDGQLKIYVRGSEGEGWFAADVDYRVTPGQIQKITTKDYYHDVSLSPDGKTGAQGDSGNATIKFWDFLNDLFSNKRVVVGK